MDTGSNTSEHSLSRQVASASMEEPHDWGKATMTILTHTYPVSQMFQSMETVTSSDWEETKCWRGQKEKFSVVLMD